MADPIISKVITVKAATTNDGEFVILRNLTRGGQLTAPVKDEAAIFNPAPNTQWREKDLLQAEIRGRLQGAKQQTIQSGGTKITIKTSTDTSSPSVSL